ncbi:N-acetylmuramoyl-L-alanine amidase [Henriciella sp.]|uniref:N-acetylmuramoyl-L-alanine amidase n=1 Tax=Henriciella sp. TaxID=1968823 RepID=UPI0026241212|nr:N-acetylmuramoyl-L-alanine amidase [Henriciella sp.]
MIQVAQTPSPNFNDRKHPVDMLVLHYTGMESGDAALEKMRSEDGGVSAHYMVWETGKTVQLVGEDKRAWHAGVATWQGDDDLNSRSIGIEIVNGGHDWLDADGNLPAYPPAQIEAVTELCKAIVDRWDIPQTRIVGHSDIAPARKKDPGEHFPWKDLTSRGIGLWPGPLKDLEGATEPALKTIGYDTRDLPAAIAAFQRRWRPERVDGFDDADTRAVALAVAQLYSAAS